MRAVGACALLVAIAAGACRRPPAAPPRPAPARVEARSYGTWRAAFEEGKLDPVVTVATVLAPHVMGIGALAGLRGEVTILDGVPWIAHPAEPWTIRVDRSAGDLAAALLVTATVPAWQSVPIGRDLPLEALEQELAQLAADSRAEPGRPLPVRIEGELTELVWRVVDGRKLEIVAFDRSRKPRVDVTGHVAAARGTLVGFYSAGQGGFAPAGSAVHLHVVLPDRQIAAHVDSVVVRQGATLLLPR
jgi:alpha-acetolactate decarboxylase